MPSPIQYAGQAVFFAAAAALTGYLSALPVYHDTPPGMAQIKLSFAHGAGRIEDCRRLTYEEISKLPPSERRPNDCARERVNVHVQLVLDGAVIYDAELQPTGLAGDGPARTYRKFQVPAGRYSLIARLRDTARGDGGFDYETRHDVTLKDWQNLAIDFKADSGGFQFR